MTRHEIERAKVYLEMNIPMSRALGYDFEVDMRYQNLTKHSFFGMYRMFAEKNIDI